MGERGSREQGRMRRSTKTPTSGTLDWQFPSLTSWVPSISPFQKKYKAFLHNIFSLFLPLPTLLEFPPPPYSLTSCTPPSSYSPRLLTPLSFSIRGTNRNNPMVIFEPTTANPSVWSSVAALGSIKTFIAKSLL